MSNGDKHRRYNEKNEVIRKKTMELNSNEIQKIIPHRYPFLLVDRILECEPGVSAKGIKCVSANEMQFMGHFPEKHVMPGVRGEEQMHFPQRGRH